MLVWQISPELLNFIYIFTFTILFNPCIVLVNKEETPFMIRLDFSSNFFLFKVFIPNFYCFLWISFYFMVIWLFDTTLTDIEQDWFGKKTECIKNLWGALFYTVVVVVVAAFLLSLWFFYSFNFSSSLLSFETGLCSKMFTFLCTISSFFVYVSSFTFSRERIRIGFPEGFYHKVLW